MCTVWLPQLKKNTVEITSVVVEEKGSLRCVVRLRVCESLKCFLIDL